MPLIHQNQRELKWRLKGNFNNKLYHTIKWYVEMFENKNFSNKDLDLKRLTMKIKNNLLIKV